MEEDHHDWAEVLDDILNEFVGEASRVHVEAKVKLEGNIRRENDDPADQVGPVSLGHDDGTAQPPLPGIDNLHATGLVLANEHANDENDHQETKLFGGRVTVNRDDHHKERIGGNQDDPPALDPGVVEGPFDQGMQEKEQ